MGNPAADRWSMKGTDFLGCTPLMLEYELPDTGQSRAYWYHSNALQHYMGGQVNHHKSVVGLVWGSGMLNSLEYHVEEDSGENRWAAGMVMVTVGCSCCCFSLDYSSGG